MVSITGSTRAGIAVATAAAKDVKRPPRAGGKAPVVVFDDVDIAAAVEGISVAGLFNGGQDCTAATRVIVQAGVYDEFLAALTEAAQGTRTGYDAADEDILYGPINNPNQLSHISGLVERAQTMRASPRRPPDRHDRLLLRATVVADVRQSDELVRTEIFGPVLTVRSSPTRTRPCASPTTPSTAWPPRCGRGHQRRGPDGRRLDFGCVWINTHIPLVGEMPHGRFKHSGYGKDLSMYGLEDYTRVKHVMLHHGFEAEQRYAVAAPHEVTPRHTSCAGGQAVRSRTSRTISIVVCGCRKANRPTVSPSHLVGGMNAISSSWSAFAQAS